MSFDGPAFIRHVAQRLVQEFAISEWAGTPGLIGAAKEHPARVQLERLLPASVRVGSGLVVDSYGGVSRQQDIVVYEKLSPVFTVNGAAEATYYPVEGVVAVGEVKSTLGKAELSDAVRKSVSVKRLRRKAVATDEGLGAPAVAFRYYGNSTCFAGAPEEQFDQDRQSLDQVYSFVLCQKFQAAPATTIGNFARECREIGPLLVPNIITSLNDGCIYPFNSRTNSITRSAVEGDGAIFSADTAGGFAQLVSMLRLYAISGRTVDQRHYERYFITGEPSSVSIHIDIHTAF